MKGHLATRLPEIVNHIISYLILPYQHEEKPTYQYIYPCLHVNALWHDCTIRLLWNSITFEDTKTEYEAFIKFASMVNYSENYSTADGLAIASANNNLPVYDYSHSKQYNNAIRAITLKKIKDKSINEPLMNIAKNVTKLEKLDIYICDHLSDLSIMTLTNNNNYLTYISLAGCNKITDEAVLNISIHCAKLQHLDLRACGLISDISISSVALNCPQLFHLNVGRVRDREKITIASIKLIAQYTQVAVLGLAGCDIADECLILLAKHRRSGLERISVNNCYRITNKSIQAYVKYCPNLSVFEMKECHWINDWDSVAELVSRKVLLTLCDQQNKACSEWARQRGRLLEVKAPIK